jgi:hypothetical protein
MPKRKAVKVIKAETVFNEKDSPWTVHYGRLNPGRGNPGSPRLFQVLGEKLPFEALNEVKKYLKTKQPSLRRAGVYVAHDSMGEARYIGRGNIFSRLAGHKKAHRLELQYFSFYVVEDRKHEREIETLLIRAAGPLLHFNTKKKRLTLSAGNINDYEAGTRFFERHYKKGKKPHRRKKEH